MATGTIDRMGVIIHTYTNNGLTFYAVKWGRICEITCYLGQTTSVISTNGTILQLDNEFFPAVRTQVSNLSSLNTRIVVNDEDGKITTVAEAPVGTAFRFTLIYITAN